MAKVEDAVTPIPAPEPGLTAKELIARAEGLREMIREQQDQAEAQGGYTQEVHEAISKAGLYRALAPKMFGGYEVDMRSYLEISINIARGDPGSGWCYGLGAHHSLILASYWPASAQSQIFAEAKGEFISPHRAGFSGNIERVSEGWRITDGRWRYSSGVPYATHFMGAGMKAPEKEGDPPQMMTYVIPRDQFEIEADSWGGGIGLGLQSSGSHTVIIKEAIVPEGYVIPDFMMMPPAITPGVELHGNPMYLGKWTGFYHMDLVTHVIGAARAALDETERLWRDPPPRAGLFGAMNQKRHESEAGQRQFGLALSATDAAETILLGTGDQFTEYCRQWAEEKREFSRFDDTRLFAQAQIAGRMASEVVEQLFRINDSSQVGRRGQRLNRYLRDVEMYRGHISAQPDMALVGLGAGYFGVGGGPMGPRPVG